MERDLGIVPLEDAVHSDSGKTIVELYVTPGSSKSCFAGYDPWRTSIKVNVRSPAKKGAANKELISLLSKSFGIEESRVEIASGSRNRSKSVSLLGMRRGEVIEVLNEALEEK